MKIKTPHAGLDFYRYATGTCSICGSSFKGSIMNRNSPETLTCSLECARARKVARQKARREARRLTVEASPKPATAVPQEVASMPAKRKSRKKTPKPQPVKHVGTALERRNKSGKSKFRFGRGQIGRGK